MSGIDAGQIALAKVWIHNGDAESKGGVTWGAGNDTTGDGTPEAPYLTLEQALKEIRVVEGQKDVTRTWELPLLTDDDETNDYGDFIFGDDVTLPDTPNAGIFILTGWLKEWGATDRGKWALIADKPKHGRINKTVAGTNGGAMVRWVTKDIEFTSSATILIQIALNSGTFTVNPTGMFKAYDCTFDWTTAPLTKNRYVSYSGSTNTVQGKMGLVGCFTKRMIDMSFSMNDGTGAVSYGDAVNCSFITRLEEHALIGTGQRRLHFLDCIVSPNGIGSWAFINQTDTNFETVLLREHMRYWMRGGSGWMRKHDNGSADQFTFVAINSFDEESSSGDPLITSISNPTILDSSPSIDKGGILSGTWVDAFDPTGNDFHKVDILGYVWGDSIDLNTPATANGNSAFSHRAVGCHQNSKVTIPGIATVVWPLGIIQVNTNYVVLEVPKDNDLLGTLQFRTFQASDAGFTADLVVTDSGPIVIGATNNKINFKEDAGAERTATLSSGNYTTQELMDEIETAMNGAPSATGTYAASYNASTEIVTISVSGSITNVQLLFLTGTDVVNSIRILTGFNPLDTSSSPTHDGEDAILENLFNTALDYEFSSDYESGLNPEVSGVWNVLGLGLPSDTGVEGTDGVSGEPADDRFVRINLGTVSSLIFRYHAGQFWNGKGKSQNVLV